MLENTVINKKIFAVLNSPPNHSVAIIEEIIIKGEHKVGRAIFIL
jgi:hypothetical protein